jgi:CRISPR-associated protein Csb2
MGLGADAQRALRSIRRTYVKGGEKPLFLTLSGMGELDIFSRDLAVPELAHASVWTSRTPFVPPRHVKAKRHTVEDQVQAELASAGLPVARRVDILPRDVILRREFHRFVRARRDREPPASRFFAVRIELEHPVQGPVALGYGSHFGLGLMTPETQ